MLMNWARSFIILGCLFYLVVTIIIIRIKNCFKFNANSGDPDQTSHFAASDLGLHCCPKSFI